MKSFLDCRRAVNDDEEFDAFVSMDVDLEAMDELAKVDLLASTEGETAESVFF